MRDAVGGLWTLDGDTWRRKSGRMRRWVGFALVVFATTLVVNVVVVSLWPENPVDWLASVVVAATTSVVLTFVYRRGEAR